METLDRRIFVEDIGFFKLKNWDVGTLPVRTKLVAVCDFVAIPVKDDVFFFDSTVQVCEIYHFSTTKTCYLDKVNVLFRFVYVAEPG